MLLTRDLGWTDRWKDRWMEGCMDGRTDGQTDHYRTPAKFFFTLLYTMYPSMIKG